MQETALVTILMSVGITHRRAVAFERHLDDKAPYGFVGDTLADLFDQHAKAALLLHRDDPAGDVQLKLFVGSNLVDRTEGDAIRK